MPPSRLLALLLLPALANSAALARAEVPPLLAEAIARWDQGAGELAFTQETKELRRDGTVKESKVERYDPSLPDQQRWRLLSVNGREPTARDRRRLEDKRNNKPRRDPLKPLGDYLDLSTVQELPGDAETARFMVGVSRENTSFFVPVDKMVFIFAVDRERATITHIDAALTEPMRIFFGIATVHDVDLDIEIAPNGQPAESGGKVTEDSTAEASVSKFGQPLEFTWTDFERVEPYRAG